MEANPFGNISLCFGNTLVATFWLSESNLIYLANCSLSGKAASMSVALQSDCVAHLISMFIPHSPMRGCALLLFDAALDRWENTIRFVCKAMLVSM